MAADKTFVPSDDHSSSLKSTHKRAADEIRPWLIEQHDTPPAGFVPARTFRAAFSLGPGNISGTVLDVDEENWRLRRLAEADDPSAPRRCAKSAIYYDYYNSSRTERMRLLLGSEMSMLAAASAATPVRPFSSALVAAPPSPEQPAPAVSSHRSRCRCLWMLPPLRIRLASWSRAKQLLLPIPLCTGGYLEDPTFS